MPIRPENKARYPRNWKEISKAIRESAGNQCEWVDAATGERCQRQHLQPIQGNEQRATILTVAHLDHIPEHCEPENLRALCQKHHLQYDAAHHASNAANTRRAKKAHLYGGTLF